MARHSVAVAAVLIHTLLGIVCAMPPGLGAPRAGPGRCIQVQCPGCNQGFKSHKAVRIHQNRMGPSSECFTDQRDPVPSAWSSRGGGHAAGRVEGRAAAAAACLVWGTQNQSQTQDAVIAGRTRTTRQLRHPTRPTRTPTRPPNRPRPTRPQNRPTPPTSLRYIPAYTCIYLRIHT